MKHLIVFLLLSASALGQSQPATVTFFREEQSMARMYMRSDYATAGASWNIYMDGMRMITLRRGRMVTFSVPPGHHDFKTDRYPRVDIDVAEGAHLFIRPTLDNHAHKREDMVRLAQVDCREYIDRAVNVEQIKPADVFTGKEVDGDQTFVQSCAGK